MNHAALDILGELLRDETIFSRVWKSQLKSLDIDDVAELLGCSVTTVKRMMERGEWIMVKGPNDRFQMTLQQFREQQRLLLTPKHTRR